MPAPLNPGRGHGAIGPQPEQPWGKKTPTGRFRRFINWSQAQIYRVSQVATEVVVQKTGNARVSQDATEVLVQKTSNARTSQVAIEVLQQTHHNALVSQVAIEVVQPSKMIQPGFAGTSSLTFTIRELHRFTVTFAGTSSFTATVTSGHGTTRNFTVTFAGVGHFTPTIRELHRFTVTFAGTSSFTASIIQTDYIIVVFAGTSQLLFGGPGPVDLSPVVFAGTSSLTFFFRIHVTFAGRSSLTFNFHRKQFVFQIHGLSSLTFFGTLDDHGAVISQIVNEIAYVGIDPEVRLSQVTLEVLRPRTGIHIKDFF